ncbi:TPA: 3-deoxy-manno-octulosonate cytidylyltransferase [Campylobacter lari subsp. concheus]|uniref:3-deoxy-manno-octulosonate cytidylyltransferase n=1 Tax=Campylobacter lari TaxID=201 RepID=UPI001287F060|nr:3-deoxy-manno-octulosonate cytidylyltransferase [Campylobacter lari]MBT0815594.1 3-deoxy-manno-octulosonate cytidylyltransferase [Campylobacter lari]
MKILGVIPARYGSTRFPGKPLADIMGKPMIWWVYQQAKKAKKLLKVVVATDDERIVKVCNQFYIPNIFTQHHESGISRIHEVSENIKADLYVQINGDEPLMEALVIDRIVPDSIIASNAEIGIHLITKIKDPVELLDPANIKVIFDSECKTLYMSRTPVPTPYKSIMFDYYKHIGILAYNKKMLDFFVSHAPQKYEIIEGLETLRFVEYGKNFLCKKVDNFNSLSVDTPKDLDKVIQIIKEKNENFNFSSR